MDVNYVSKLSLFLGKPIQITESLKFYSPTVSEIEYIGEGLYETYIKVLSFDLKEIFVDLMGQEEKKVREIDPKDTYYVIVLNKQIRELICEALCFFSKNDEIFFDEENLSYNYKDEILVSFDLYGLISNIVREINGVEKPVKEKIPKFLNKIAEDMYFEAMKKRRELESKKNKGSGLDLKNMLSILCVFQGNGISFDNVENLTIYQVKEHYDRLILKEVHNRTLPLWASGNMDNKAKVPEWMTRTKL